MKLDWSECMGRILLDWEGHRPTRAPWSDILDTIADAHELRPATPRALGRGVRAGARLATSGYAAPSVVLAARLGHGHRVGPRGWMRRASALDRAGCGMEHRRHLLAASEGDVELARRVFSFPDPFHHNASCSGSHRERPPRRRVCRSAVVSNRDALRTRLCCHDEAGADLRRRDVEASERAMGVVLSGSGDLAMARRFATAVLTGSGSLSCPPCRVLRPPRPHLRPPPTL